ncbi:hypothetical protein MUO98_05580 [Candidatus Bathyarchaeota archaeon]|nr:hypothetical protein [Candidatus Bathyarchaeota archaeon]
MAQTGKEKKREGSSVRNLLALGFVSFFTDMSSEMVFSLLPPFLLGLPGSIRAVLGLIEGTAEALSYSLRAVSGIFSDKFRKQKLFVLVGYSLSNAIKPLFAVARAPFDVLLIKVSDRVGNVFVILFGMLFSVSRFLRIVGVPLLVYIGLLIRQALLWDL